MFVMVMLVARMLEIIIQFVGNPHDPIGFASSKLGHQNNGQAMNPLSLEYTALLFK